MRLLLAIALGLSAVCCSPAATRMIVIGDSLSAEYDALPDFPGIENPTEYARITVPGWESMSWVEVLGKLRAADIDLGDYRDALPGWSSLRFTGYEFNFAIPGFTAAQYADITESSLFSNPQFLPVRLALEDTLRADAEVAVIGLGGNDFRSEYGNLYEGADPAKLVARLKKDWTSVIDFVLRQKRGMRVVLLNVPDLGATPAKREAHPDPAKRALVSAAIAQANQELAALATARGCAVADIYAQTRRLINGETTWFGPVGLIDDRDEDNDPHYHFTREGLHPNTGSQLEVARAVIAAMNGSFSLGIPLITDREALSLLGIHPDEPFHLWATGFALAEASMNADPDGDGLVNLVEYAFALNPVLPDQSPVRYAAENGRFTVNFKPDLARARHVRVWPQSSSNLVSWSEIPATQIAALPDGSLTVTLNPGGDSVFLRLQVSLLP